MSTEQIAQRIAGRREAEILLELSDGHLSENRAYREGFWGELRRQANLNVPVEPPPKKPIEPMSDAQAKAFDARAIPFGKHAGSLVSTIAHCDPQYLIWLADAPNEFQQDLKRYLRNTDVARDLEGDDA